MSKMTLDFNIDLLEIEQIGRIPTSMPSNQRSALSISIHIWLLTSAVDFVSMRGKKKKHSSSVHTWTRFSKKILCINSPKIDGYNINIVYRSIISFIAHLPCI